MIGKSSFSRATTGNQNMTEKHRVLHKKEYLVIIRDNFCYAVQKPYVVIPHLNCLDGTVQMRGQ